LFESYIQPTTRLNLNIRSSGAEIRRNNAPAAVALIAERVPAASRTMYELCLRVDGPMPRYTGGRGSAEWMQRREREMRPA
jgi:hypothetical protein